MIIIFVEFRVYGTLAYAKVPGIVRDDAKISMAISKIIMTKGTILVSEFPKLETPPTREGKAPLVLKV